MSIIIFTPLKEIIMKCQICNWESNSLSKHVYKQHGMTAEEYTVKYIVGSRPSCKNCNTPLKFIKLSKPFGDFCSSSCRSSHTISVLNTNKDFQNKAKYGQRESIKNNPEVRYKKQLIARSNLLAVNSDRDKYFPPEVVVSRNRKSSRTRLKNLDKDKNRINRYLYLIEYSNYLKIGSCVDIIHRKNDLDREINESGVLLFSHIGPSEIILDLELDLTSKYSVTTKVMDINGGSELVDKSHRAELLSTLKSVTTRS
jgi:hypothetical protein